MLGETHVAQEPPGGASSGLMWASAALRLSWSQAGGSQCPSESGGIANPLVSQRAVMEKAGQWLQCASKLFADNRGGLRDERDNGLSLKGR